MNRWMRILMFVCAAAMFAACENSPETDTPKGNGLTYKSCDKYVALSGEEQTFSVTIQTSGAWTARVSGGFAEVSPASGNAGRSTLKVSLARNTTGEERTSILSVTVEGFKGQTLCQITQSAAAGGDSGEEGATQGTATGIIKFMDDYLDANYLYNEAYRNTNRNYNLAYDRYLDNVLKQMYDKGQNLKDGHMYSNAYSDTWYFYSYIEKLSSTRAQTRAKSTLYGFGIDANVVALNETQTQIGFYINFVYPDSPAEKKGLKRGDIIYKLNGTIASSSNYVNIFYDYFYDPHTTSRNVNLTLLKIGEGNVFSDGDVIAISSGYYYPTPVVFSAVYEVKGTRIGHLVYTSYDSDYDRDLKNALTTLKGYDIKNLILDLRYNGGGAVSSARMLSSILAGTACDGKIFTYYRYNDERMAAQGRDKNDHKTYDSDDFDGSVAAEYGFDFDRIYVICTEDSASCSELTINALRGIDKKVIVTGAENTNGKDVGMEGYSSIFVQDDGYYAFFPITFQTYNAKGESDYDDGFAPDLKTKDYEYNVPFEDWGAIYAYNTTNKLYPTDFVSDIFFDIAGSDITPSADIKILYKSNAATTATRGAAEFAKISERRGLKRSKALQIPEKNIRKTNMYIMREAEIVQ